MQKKQKERLTDEQRTLVEENVGLAKRIAWKYHAVCAPYGMDWNDVFSMWWMCMWSAQAKRSAAR